MKYKNPYKRKIAFPAVAVAIISLLLSTSLVFAERPKLNLPPPPKRPEEPAPRNLEPAPEKEYDQNMKIYISGKKPIYGPDEKPAINVCFKNDAPQTVYMRRLWSSARGEGVNFQIFIDDKEQLGSGYLSRRFEKPESKLPADALKLDAGKSDCVMTLNFTHLSEGEHTLRVEYSAFYSISEKKKKNWWNGNAKSNDLTLRISRVLPEDQLKKVTSDVIKNIHFDLKRLRASFPSIADYKDASLSSAKGLYRGISVIDFTTLKPRRRVIKVYFNDPVFQPGTAPIFDEAFTYLGIKLFLHIDAEDEPRLRNAILSIVKNREKELYRFTANSARQTRVEIDPVSPEVSMKIRRAGFIVTGTVKSVKIEDLNDYNGEYRMWLLNVAVKEVFLGEVKEKVMIVKSGALTTNFGNEKIVGKTFVMLLADKNHWQKEYTLIGTEPPGDNLMQWLRTKFGAKKK